MKEQPRPRGYSYVRFSTAEQRLGKSLERQSEGAVTWCKQHGVELDTELSLQDLGVSAFRGKNADVGALKTFLKAVHSGSVASGSYLLVENFDRISREAAYDAQVTVQNIVNAGVTIVTLMDGKEYSVKLLRADPMSLVYMILMFTRGHEESMTKSKRIGDAWQRKRDRLKHGEVLTAITPGWLSVGVDRKIRLIPARVKVVQKMFHLLLTEKLGSTTIAEHLNRKGTATFGGGMWWTAAYIKVCLRNRAVLGEFQPHRNDHSGPTRRRIPDGAPIKNYYPLIIDRATFDKAQKQLAENARTRSPRQVQGLRNMLAGLARCPECGDLMSRVLKKPRAAPKLVCSRARAGAGCLYRVVPVPVIERALIAGAETFVAEIPEVDATLAARVTEVESAIKASETRRFDFAMLLDDTPSKTIAERIQKEEAECERLKAELETLRTRASRNSTRLIRESARRAKDALLWHVTDPSDIAGVNAALKECFARIVVDYSKLRLVLHWRHGPTTPLSYESFLGSSTFGGGRSPGKRGSGAGKGGTTRTVPSGSVRR